MRELESILTKLSTQEAEIEFDPALHKYVADGVEYPSVNKVLQDGGIVDTKWFKEGGAERGIRIHHICELADKDTGGMRLFMDESLEEYEGYLDAWEDFKEKGYLNVEGNLSAKFLSNVSAWVKGAMIN